MSALPSYVQALEPSQVVQAPKTHHSLQFRQSLQNFIRVATGSSNPGDNLTFIQGALGKAAKGQLTDVDYDYFTSTALPSIVGSLLGRQDLTPSQRLKVNLFFQEVLEFLSTHIGEDDNSELYTILYQLFSSDSPFYSATKSDPPIQVLTSVFGSPDSVTIPEPPSRSSRSSKSSSRSSRSSASRKSRNSTSSRRRSKSEKPSLADKKKEKSNSSAKKSSKKGSSPTPFVTLKPRTGLPSKVSPLLPLNINFFGSVGGFDNIVRRVAVVQDQARLPPAYLEKLLLPLVPATPFLSSTFSSEFAPKLQGEVKNHLFATSSGPIEPTDRIIVGAINDIVATLLMAAKNAKIAAEQVERFDLDWALQLFNSQESKKQYMAMEIIKENMIKAARKSPGKSHPPPLPTLTVPSASKADRRRSSNKPPPAPPRPYDEKDQWVEPSDIISWLESNSIPQAILTPGSLDIEMLKMTGDLFTFIAKYSAKSTTILNAMWTAISHSDTDLSMRHSLFAHLSEMSPFLINTDVEIIYKGVRSIALEEIDTPALDLALAVTQVSSKLKKLEPKFGIHFFWELLQDDSGVKSDIRARAQESFAQILSSADFAHLRVPYIDECVANVTSQKSVLTTLKLIETIVRMYPERQSGWGKKGESMDMVLAKKGPSVLDAFFADLSQFKKSSAAELMASMRDSAVAKKSASRRTPADDVALDAAVAKFVPSTHGVPAKYPDHISRRLAFLDFVLAASPVTLNTKQVDKLWEGFVTSSLGRTERETTLSWLARVKLPSAAASSSSASAAGLSPAPPRKNKPDAPKAPGIAPAAPTPLASSSATVIEPTGGSFAVLSDAVVDHIFLETMAKVHYSWVNPSGFALFKRLFFYANEAKGKLDAPSSRTLAKAAPGAYLHKLSSTAIVGVDNLWRLALFADSQDVADAAISLLANVHSYFSSSTKSSGAALRIKLVEKCIDIVRNTKVRTAKEGQGKATSGQVKSEQTVQRALKTLEAVLAASAETTKRLGGTHRSIVRTSNVALTVHIHAPSSAPANVSGVNGEYVYASHDADTVGAVRAAVLDLFKDNSADAAHVPAKALRLLSRGKELAKDDQTLKEAGLSTAPTLHVGLRMKDIVASGTGKANQAVPVPPKTPEQVIASAVGGSLTTPRAGWDKSSVEAALSSTDNMAILLSLLSASNPAVASSAWSVVNSLPTLPTLATTLVNLKPLIWDNLIPSAVTLGLAYNLTVLEALLRAPGSGETWGAKFLEAGGLGHLLKLFNRELPKLSAKTSSLTTPVLDAIAVLLRVVDTFAFEGTSAAPTLARVAAPGSGIVAHGRHLSDSFANNPSVDLEHILQVLSSLVSSISRSSSPGKDAATTAVAMIADITASKPALANVWIESELPTWIQDGLLGSPSDDFRGGLAVALQAAWWRLRLTSSSRPVASKLLQTLVSVLSTIGEDHASTCSEFFSLLNALLRAGGDLDAAGHANIFHSLLGMITAHPVLETAESVSNLQEDTVVVGMLKTFHTLVDAGITSGDVKGQLAQDIGGLLNELFTRCLFAVPSVERRGLDATAKCKTPVAREAAYNLTLALIGSNKTWYDVVLDMASEQLRAVTIPPSWEYNPRLLGRGPSGYVGLENLGATCYMNSLMQQFFMIPSFRKGLLAAPPVEGEAPNESLLGQTQMLMAFLQESQRRFFNTRAFTGTYKDFDGSPINPLQQQDANEFFNVYFDRLETAVKGTEQAKIMDNIFQGHTLNQIICRGTPSHHSERSESFYTFSVDVKGHKNLAESLDAFVTGEMLEGDSQYMCESCNRKVDALKRIVIQDLPNTMVVHLKRFEFDLHRMANVKVNDKFEFPTLLDMYPYTKEGLAAKETGVTAGTRPQSYYAYELVGVLVHYGTATSGHYYSYIRERVPRTGQERKWFEFNDRKVTPFDPATLPEHTFGGPNPRWGGMRNLPYNAYMLFYERISYDPTQAATAIEAINPAGVSVPPNLRADIPTSTPGLRPYMNSMLTAKLARALESRKEESAGAGGEGIATPILSSIWDDNSKFKTQDYLYDPKYFEFAWSLLKESEFRDSQSFELSTYFVLFVLVYARQKSHLPQWWNHLRNEIDSNAMAARWFVRLMSEQESTMTKMLLVCPLPEVRREFSLTLTLAMRKTHEADLAKPPASASTATKKSKKSKKKKRASKKGMAGAAAAIGSFLGGAGGAEDPADPLTELHNTLFKLFEVDPRGTPIAEFLDIYTSWSELGEPALHSLVTMGGIATFADFFTGHDPEDLVPKPGTRRVPLPSVVGGRRYTGEWPEDRSDRATLLRLITSCVKYSRSGKGGADAALHDEDIDALFGTRFLVLAGSDEGLLGQVAALMLYLATEHEENSRQIINLLILVLTTPGYDPVKPFRKLFVTLLNVADSKTTWRINYGYNQLLTRVSKMSEPVQRETRDSVLKWMVALAKNNASVATWLGEEHNRERADDVLMDAGFVL